MENQIEFTIVIFPSMIQCCWMSNKISTCTKNSTGLLLDTQLNLDRCVNKFSEPNSIRSACVRRHNKSLLQTHCRKYDLSDLETMTSGGGLKQKSSADGPQLCKWVRQF